MAVKIFFCYAHEDEALLNKLKTHLKPLQRQGLINMWHDRDISAGAEWEQEISEQLNTAQIILLLVSPDFMDSDYCYGVEMKRALERHENGETHVIPVILRHVYWKGEPLGKLQALPRDAIPVKSWQDQDEALYNVVEGIRKVVSDLALNEQRETKDRGSMMTHGLFGQNKAIEQLWYAWSDVGLDTIGAEFRIRAGFRIRAASEGLKDVRSVRVQNLDRYQRYSLPRDVDPAAIDPHSAPICLSLIITGQERILVHKAYTGNNAVGLYGTFFTHLLANLPEDFSAMDAISLWRSRFWQVSDGTLDRRNTNLNYISVEHLVKMQKYRHLNPKNTVKVRKFLPYVIQAYLTKKPLIEKKTVQTVPQKLYIAASDDDIAQLISGLTRCLPPQLLKDLTFSTYEHDITQATTEIIGTCWLSIPKAEKDPHVKHLLPAQYYQEKLAINCYTEEKSPLENNPLVENKPLVAQFAQDATEHFVQGDMDDFEELLDTANNTSGLNVDKFLELYESRIVRAQNPSKQDIELLLRPRPESK